MERIVVCQTPLHFLLASIILKDEKSGIVFLWIEESGISRRYIDAVVSFHSGRLIHMQGIGQSRYKIARLIRRLLNIRILKKRGLSKSCAELIVFNDTTPEVQFLVVSMRSAASGVVLGEDGVALYGPGGHAQISVLDRMIATTLYGKWWNAAPKIGLHPSIMRVYASHPDLVRDELAKNREVLGLPPVRPSFLTKVLDSLSPGPTEIAGAVLCIVPLSSAVGMAAVAGFLKSAQGLNRRLALKLHPRELQADALAISASVSGSQHIMLPRNLPAELFCMGPGSPTVVVGYRSSAMHLIHALNPKVQTMYYEPSTDVDGVEWRDFYNQAGVHELKLDVGKLAD